MSSSNHNCVDSLHKTPCDTTYKSVGGQLHILCSDCLLMPDIKSFFLKTAAVPWDTNGPIRAGEGTEVP